MKPLSTINAARSQRGVGVGWGGGSLNTCRSSRRLKAWWGKVSLKGGDPQKLPANILTGHRDAPKRTPEDQFSGSPPVAGGEAGAPEGPQPDVASPLLLRLATHS